jgi:uncharacterized protein (TIGR03435 family)
MTTTTSNGITITRSFSRATPDGYSVGNGTLKLLIMEAYRVKWDSIVGGPDWIGTTGYDIDAKVTPAADAPPPKLTGAQARQMIQSLLADRFKLVVHDETKDAPIYKSQRVDRSSPNPLPATASPRGSKGPTAIPYPAATQCCSAGAGSSVRRSPSTRSSTI